MTSYIDIPCWSSNDFYVDSFSLIFFIMKTWSLILTFVDSQDILKCIDVYFKAKKIIFIKLYIY